MQKLGSLLAAVAVICGGLSAASKPRYFKEDGGVQATYIAIAPDGSYAVTAREHMFLRVEESGRWSRRGSRIMFIPKKSATPPYNAEEVSYKRRVFLVLQSDGGPSIRVPVAEIERSLDQNPKELPLYVFFEISSAVYKQENKRAYPFHTLPQKQ